MTAAASAEIRHAKGRIIVPSPEGVPLQFELASISDRALAFFLDNLIIFGILLLCALGLFAGPPPGYLAVLLLLLFVLKHFYFVIMETRGRGSTPGKRKRRLRVVDAAGAALDARSLVVRNLLRELDTYLPLSLVPLIPELWPEAPGWAGGLILVWMILVFLVPVIDKKRRRLGDFVAGTLVLAVPRPVLLPDLADRATSSDHEVEAEYQFTEQQLGRYGIYELQVLEQVLRQGGASENVAARAAVSEKIRERIEWKGGPVRNHPFLTAFYQALRTDLERRMLFGERREDKTTGEGTPTRTPKPDR